MKEDWKSMSFASKFKNLDKDIWYQNMEDILGNYSWTKVPGLVGINEIVRKWAALSGFRQTRDILVGNLRLS